MRLGFEISIRNPLRLSPLKELSFWPLLKSADHTLSAGRTDGKGIHRASNAEVKKMKSPE